MFNSITARTLSQARREHLLIDVEKARRVRRGPAVVGPEAASPRHASGRPLADPV
jgi:hypothetical protein